MPIILDTNVLLFDPQALGHFPEQHILLPLEVVEDLDRFKHGSDETARNARLAALQLDALRKNGSLRQGVKLENGAIVQIVLGKQESGRSDTAILNLAQALHQKGEETQIITKSVNLRLKADALGLSARDYGQETPLDTEVTRGWRRIQLPPEEVATLQAGRPVLPGKRKFHPNEYVAAAVPGNPKNLVCARFLPQDGKLWPLLSTTRSVCGIHSLNLEQTFCLDALLDPNIPLFTMAGRAGTGKTLLAIAAALQQIFGDGKYRKLLVFRPTMPVSRDLGYLPGDLNDKMRPWMQPVYDALEFIRALDKKQPSRVLPNDVLTCQEISVEPLTYIRGRSIPGQFIIIDEAQNLTPLEVKTAITRVGAGSKIVLTGDPAQIDNPYVDSQSNGLTRLVARFLDSPLAAHITLRKGERSKLAETASALL